MGLPSEGQGTAFRGMVVCIWRGVGQNAPPPRGIRKMLSKSGRYASQLILKSSCKLGVFDTS